MSIPEDGRSAGPDAEPGAVEPSTVEPGAVELGAVGQGAVEQGGLEQGGLGRTDWTVPTMDDMRAKIDARSAAAAGQAELDQLSGAGKQQARTVEQRDKAAQERLAAIRATLGDG